MRHLPLSLVLILLLALFPPSPAAAQTAPPDPVDHLVETHDGLLIAVTLYRAHVDGNDPRPAILTTHGWGNDRTTRAGDAAWLTDLGYHVLAYDSRGFGDSEGLVAMNGPNEVADVSRLIDWWVAHANQSANYALQMDADNDPRMAMTGMSYAGAIQLLAAAHDSRIDALVPDITWSDLRQSLAPNGVAKRGWVDFLFWSGTLGAHGLTSGSAPNQGGLDPRLRDWYLEALQTGRFPATAHEPLAQRSPIEHIHNISADVLLLQGWTDTLFDPDQAHATFMALRERADAETHLVLHDGGHSTESSPQNHDAIRGMVERFLARHLLDAADAPLPPVRLLDVRTNGWLEQDVWDQPQERHLIDLAASEGIPQVTLHQAATPTSHTEGQALTRFADPGPIDATDAAAAALPTSRTFDTGIKGPTTIGGRPTVTLQVDADVTDVTLFASLVDIAPDGIERVLHGQVQGMRVTVIDQPQDVTIPLVSTLHSLPAGHTLGLRVTTSDSAYSGSRETGTVTLHLVGAELTIPVADAPQLSHQGPTNDGPTNAQATATTPGVAVAPLLLLGIAMAGMLRARRD